jgi:hypothetical protein
MENCFKCNEGLDDSIKSAVKEDGSYYILCKNCGNVMYITKNAFGHPIVRNTADDNSEETKAQIVEAYELFKNNGFTPALYSTSKDSEKRSIGDLIYTAEETEEVKEPEVVKEAINVTTEKVDDNTTESNKGIFSSIKNICTKIITIFK